VKGGVTINIFVFKGNYFLQKIRVICHEKDCHNSIAHLTRRTKRNLKLNIYVICKYLITLSNHINETKITLSFLCLIIFAQNSKQTIGFKENKGQIIDQNGKPNDAVKYLLNSAGLNVQLKRMDFRMTFMKPKTSYKTTHRR
jgi:hypothetical protein